MFNLSVIEDLYHQGNNAVILTLSDGSKQKMRLFESVNGLCYYGKNKHRWGYRIADFRGDIISVIPVINSKHGYNRYISNLYKFKKAFSTATLWDDLKDGYAKLDIPDFEHYISLQNVNKDDSYELWKLLRPYCEEKKIHIIHENHYKTTTIKSNKPARYTGGQYYACIENIEKQIANRQEFSYDWRSNYDVHVSANTGADGIYRGWLSLEYKDCGNGHYYLLIDSNRAVFAEDD